MSSVSPSPSSAPAAAPTPAKATPLPPLRRRFRKWFFTQDQGGAGHHSQKPWWQVMCLTGVDYFSTLGYQPGIAFLAAGVLSPLATFILVLMTLLAALPVYSRIAAASPHGSGSISILEHMLSKWKGKLFVLTLLGFAATDFVITITLSAADATAHLIENPFMPTILGSYRVEVTLALIGLLAAVFLKGFKEAIGIAVVVVASYLTLNLVVIGYALWQLTLHPAHFADWEKLIGRDYPNPFVMVGVAILVFPKLALGLSGFETGVAVMPLVRGDATDTHDAPTGRIRNTRKLLVTAAIIMSCFLITSSLATTLLIPAAEFASGGKANGRALAYLAHELLGEGFGTIYDVSTILILWFAGASAMAGLLNIVPRYLPRYGMAPNWARATRPLIVVFSLIAFFVTWWFEASVDLQGAAYATGVLMLMTSAAIAVLLMVWPSRLLRVAYGLIAVVFAYTTIINIYERPEGLHIASFFIFAIVMGSILSRVLRSVELRVDTVELDEGAEKIMAELEGQSLRLIANQPDYEGLREYQEKEQEQREINHLPAGEPIAFLEVEVVNASDFAGVLRVRGVKTGPYRVFCLQASTVPNAIAAFMLFVRDRTGAIPHIYYHWSEGNPVLHVIKFLLFGEGDVAPVTREVLRRAEPNLARRPKVHVSG